jgi:hypothetical protein
VSQVDGVIVVREVDGEGQGVAVPVLLVEHGLVAVVPVEHDQSIFLIILHLLSKVNNIIGTSVLWRSKKLFPQTLVTF